MGREGDRGETCPVQVVEIDLAAECELLVPELGGDGLALLERLPDAALLLVVQPLLPLQALPVQVLPPEPRVTPQHLVESPSKPWKLEGDINPS